jgi:hypothetical protein
MFKLNEMVLVSNLVGALEHENGQFLITAPTGEALEVRIESGYVRIECEEYFAGARRDDMLWTILKIRELNGNSAQTEEGSKRNLPSACTGSSLPS